MKVLHNLHRIRSFISSQAKSLDVCTNLFIFDAILGELPLFHRCKDPEHIAGVPMSIALF